MSGIVDSLLKRTLASALALSVLISPLPAPRPAAAAEGYLTDTASHPPPTSGPLAYYANYGSFGPDQSGFPKIGETYVDPVFGSTVRRLTNELAQGSNSEIYAKNGYINADATMMHHRAANLAHTIIDTTTGQVIRTGVPFNRDSSWAPDDPNVFYWFATGGTALNKYSVTTGTSTLVKNFAGSLGFLGASVDNIDGSGRYMVLNISNVIKVYDLKSDILYSGDIPASYGGGGGWMGISPDGNYVLTAAPPTQHHSFVIDHANKSVSTTPVMYWSSCGDHGDFVSASNGKTYFITFECHAEGAIYAVDVSLPQSTSNEAKQRSDNKKIAQMASWSDVAGHFSGVSKGAMQDWGFVSVEGGDDKFSTPVTSSWRPYTQEIMMFNVLTGEVRRLAHSRSRDPRANYYHTPRVSVSYDGSLVTWASNMGYNGNGYVDIYAIKNPGGAPSGGGETPPPSASLALAVSAPSAGATVSGSSTVTMAASGGSGSGYTYTLQVDGTTVSTGPASYTWDTTKASNGSHTLTATVTDSAGASASAAPVAITVQNTAPSVAVSFSNPASGATVSGTVTVSVAASGGSGGYTHTVKAGTATIYSGTNGSFSWNTTATPNGAATLSATSTDSAGTSGSATRAVTVSNTITPPPPPPPTGDTTPPTAKITSPNDKVWTGNSINVAASATDNAALKSIELWGAGKAFATLPCSGTACSGSYRWNTGALKNGAYQVNAVAVDAAGNRTVSATVTINKNATSPVTPSGATGGSTTPPPPPPPAPALTALFTSPAAGATVTGTTAFTLAIANATGSITVAPSLDGTALPSQTVSGTTASISVNTTAVANGSHTVAVTVTDGAAKTANASVTVNVNNVVATPPPPPPPTGDTTAPTVKITSPSSNVWTGNSINVAASATDDKALKSIELWGAGKMFANLACFGTSCSSSAQWITGVLPNGAYQVNAVAVDAAGNRTVSGVVTIFKNATSPLIASGANGGSTTPPPPPTPTGDTTAPTAKITSPGSIAWTGNSINVSASATDDKALKNIELWGAGKLFAVLACSGTTCSGSYQWNTSGLANGGYLVNAVAVDAAGNRTVSATITINKNATSPMTASGAK